MTEQNEKNFNDWTNGYQAALRSVKEIIVEASQRLGDQEAQRQINFILKEIDQLMKKSEAAEQVVATLLDKSIYCVGNY